MATEVSQLPPTLGIKDPEVRSFLDALSNAWDQRSGTIDIEDNNRFITKGEFQGMANQAVLNLFAGGRSGGSGNGGGGGGTGTVEEIIGTISDYIKKTYLYKLLGTEFEYIDVKGLNSKIDDVLGTAKTLFLKEQQARSSETEAITKEVTLQASRIDQNTAAIETEKTTRATKDSALAAAINRIWASVGGSSAVIEDGGLAAVTPSAAQATKWNQVQAEVIDPNTGNGKVTAVRQDMTSYINKTDGTLRSTWSVRAEATTNGRTVVGGFGLALTDSGEAGPTIDFGVRADKFWIGNTSGDGDLPFIVLTNPTNINGTIVPPGAYIKSAFIHEASVDVLKIKGRAVTQPYYSKSVTNQSMGPTPQVLDSFWVTVPEAAGPTSFAITSMSHAYPSDSNSVTFVHGIAINWPDASSPTGFSGKFLEETGLTFRDGGVVQTVQGYEVLNPGSYLIVIYQNTQYTQTKGTTMFVTTTMAQSAYR